MDNTVIQALNSVLIVTETNK